MSCIPESGYCCLFVPLFLHFSFSLFFITLFSGTVRLTCRRLKFGTHMDSGQMYRVYWNQATAAYLSLYFFIFLSLNFHFFLFLQFLVHNMSFSSHSGAIVRSYSGAIVRSSDSSSLDRNFNETYFLLTKLGLTKCLRNVYCG